MKREKYVVSANCITSRQTFVFIIDAFSEDKVRELVLEEIKNPATFDLTVMKHKNVPKIVEKQETVFDILKKGYTEEAFNNLVKLYQKMVIERKVGLKSLKDLFAPYIILYDHKNEQFFTGGKMEKGITEGIGTKQLLQIGFRYLPKKYDKFNIGNDVFTLYLNSLHPDPTTNNSLRIRDMGNQSMSLVEFFQYFRKLIPDLPLRFERLMIDKL